jgi:hypothetical protein
MVPDLVYLGGENEKEKKKTINYNQGPSVSPHPFSAFFFSYERDHVTSILGPELNLSKIVCFTQCNDVRSLSSLFAWP